jgi:hypothetical protein
VENLNTVFIKYFLHCVFKELILLTDWKCFVCNSDIKKHDWCYLRHCWI